MPRPAFNEMNLFFFDSETSGLNPYRHEMIEVAYLITDATGKKVIKEYSAKVMPTKPVEPDAAAINGYTPEVWAKEAIPIDHAFTDMLAVARDTMLVGQNIYFDWSFLEVALIKRGARWPGSYYKIDTAALAIPLVRAGIIPNIKLSTLSNFFKVPHENAHTALADVKACKGVYVKLMELYYPITEQLKLSSVPIIGDSPAPDGQT